MPSALTIDQAGEPASQGGQQRQGPDVEADVLAEGRVGLAEGNLRPEAEPRLPGGPTGQAKADADHGRRGRDGGEQGGQASGVAVFFGGDASEAPGGVQHVGANEDCRHDRRDESEAKLGGQAQGEDVAQTLSGEPASVEPHAQDKWAEDEDQHAEAEECQGRTHGQGSIISPARVDNHGRRESVEVRMWMFQVV